MSTAIVNADYLEAIASYPRYAAALAAWRKLAKRDEFTRANMDEIIHERATTQNPFARNDEMIALKAERRELPAKLHEADLAVLTARLEAEAAYFKTNP